MSGYAPPPAGGDAVYFVEGEEERRDAAAVKAQLEGHFRTTGIEGVAIKYEAAVTEIAALRRQLLAYKLAGGGADLEHSQQRNYDAGYSGLMGHPELSPPRSPTGRVVVGDAAEGSHRRTFRGETERLMWNAMNVDVVTKLEAIDTVERLRGEYEEMKREATQELAVKDEVVEMLTEQVRQMVERSQYNALKTENKVLLEQLHTLKREKEILMLKQTHDDYSHAEREASLAGEVQARVDAAVHEAQTTVAAQRDALQEELDQMALLNTDLSAALRMAQEDVKETRKDLDIARTALYERERDHQSVSEIQKQLSANEEMVRELADSLQAQAISHKAAVSMKNDQDERIHQLTDDADARQELIARLQDRLLEKEEQLARTTELLAERESEVLALQNQLEGFTEHLEGHLREKEAMVRKCTEPLEDALQARELRLVEAETKAGVLQQISAEKIAELKAQVDELRRDLALCEEMKADEVRQRGSLQDEVARLEAERDEKSTAIQVLASKQVETADAELASCRLIIARLEKELHDRQTLFDEQNETIAALHTRVLGLEGEKQAALRERNAFERRISEFMEKQADTEEASNELRSKSTAAILNLTTQLDDAEQMILKLNDSIKAFEEDEKRLKIDNMQQRRDHERKLRDQDEKAEARLKEVKANCDVELRQNRAAMTKAVRQYEQEVANAKKTSRELKKADATVKQLQRDIAAKTEMMTEKNLSAQEELESTRTSINWISANLEEVSAQLTARDETIASYKAACERKDADHSELKSLLHKSSEALALMQAASEKANAESKAQVTILERGLYEAEEATAAAEHQRAAAEAQLLETRECLMRERDELCDVVTKLRDAQTAARLQAVDEREAAERRLQDTIQSLQDSLESREFDHRMEKTSLHDKLARAEALVEEMQREGTAKSLLGDELASRKSALDLSQQLNLSVQEELLSRHIQTEATMTLHQLLLEENNASLKLQLADADADANQLRAALAAAEDQVRAIDADAKALIEARTQHTQDAEETAAALQAAQAAADELTADVAGLRTEVAAKDGESARLRSELATAQDVLRGVIEAAEAMKEHDDADAERRDAARKRMDDALEAGNAAVAQVESLKAELERKDGDISELCAALDEAMKEVRTLRDASEAMKSHRSNATQEPNPLEPELAACREKLAVAQAAAAAAQGEASARSVADEEREAERRTMSMQLEAHRTAAVEKDAQMQLMALELEELRAHRAAVTQQASNALGDVHSHDLAQLAAKQDTQRAELAAQTLRVRLAGTEDLLKRAEETITAMEAQLEEANQRLRDRDARAAAELQAVEREYERGVTVLRADLAAKDASLRSMNGQIDTLRRACAAVEHGALAEQALGERTAEVHALQHECARKEEQLRALEGAAKMGREEALQLRRALSDEVARVARLNERLEFAQAAGTALQTLRGMCDPLFEALKHSGAGESGGGGGRFSPPPPAGPAASPSAADVLGRARAWCDGYERWSASATAPPDAYAASPPRSQDLLRAGITTTPAPSLARSKTPMAPTAPAQSASFSPPLPPKAIS
eukprot:TRINITY_DN18028_c0_g1_i1.p1 TRINITY_DN18028_c0_g1~~TRINITY_DN18028_c0_g1_i1.p1  ORF type:complete len:1551 (+),score=709.93 TRINITY_DN18028_c0_g1_i1:98-4750(+)